VAARIPTRTNDDDRYFSDTFQFMPLLGYKKLFENMLDHENIESRTGVDFFQENLREISRKIIFTGPIDRYFDYCFGKLPYRSLEFVHEFIDENEKYQDVGTVNYPNHEAFTRITEFKHLTGQKVNGTSIVKEYPQSSGDPYYPIPNKNNEDLYQKYLNKAEEQDNVFFVGRLAQYRYYNMDQVVASALKLSEDLLNKNE
jgi:UDP-galactopyranose mutase